MSLSCLEQIGWWANNSSLLSCRDKDRACLLSLVKVTSSVRCDKAISSKGLGRVAGCTGSRRHTRRMWGEAFGVDRHLSRVHCVRIWCAGTTVTNVSGGLSLQVKLNQTTPAVPAVVRAGHMLVVQKPAPVCSVLIPLFDKSSGSYPASQTQTKL